MSEATTETEKFVPDPAIPGRGQNLVLTQDDERLRVTDKELRMLLALGSIKAHWIEEEGEPSAAAPTEKPTQPTSPKPTPAANSAAPAEKTAAAEKEKN